MVTIAGVGDVAWFYFLWGWGCDSMEVWMDD